MSYEERQTVLLACRYVDDVLPNIDGANSRTAILAVQPDLIIVGSDWATRDYYKQMSFTQEWLDNCDIALMYLPYTQGISTTEIKKRLSGKLEA
jgi:glycerol-3-phosphate cytidylyltransferase